MAMKFKNGNSRDSRKISEIAYLFIRTWPDLVSDLTGEVDHDSISEIPLVDGEEARLP